MSSQFTSGLTASCIAIDFILVGNAVTQSFMTLPTLILDFPPASSPDYISRARLLGRQWPLCWTVGNNFFRPISTIATVGYGVLAWSLSRSGAGVTSYSERQNRDWRLFALNAALHVTVIVHSAVNMQPLNDRIAALGAAAKEPAGDAVAVATKWMKWNLYRLVVPALTGTVALWQSVF